MFEIPKFKLDLQGKFRVLIIIGLGIWLLNFSVIYFEINNINLMTISLEQVEDLYNTILEIRRYEKNYLLYGAAQDLDETRTFFNRAEKALALVSSDLGSGKNDSAAGKLNTALSLYKGSLDELTKSDDNNRPSEETEETIRAAGKDMVNLSMMLLSDCRNRVARAAENALKWPIMFMGFFLVIFVLGALIITRKVVNPLVELERATEKIARGDFGSIPHSIHVESQVDRLILAFNRMAAELEARQEQIIHSRKIASLGTLVSGVAHELNNPINNIVLTIDSLVGGRKISDEKRLKLLDDILKQAVRASEIVKNLLDFSRAETSAFQDVDVGVVLNDTLQIASNQIAVSDIRLKKNINGALPKITGNRQGLQQVFLNLVVNAVQAMPGGGDLTVSASQDKTNRIIITVEDTGTGIPEDDLPRIFDPFFTTKEVGKGTGLGLSVSHGIIKKHGGGISVESRLGKGSVFTITLPAAQGAG